MDGKEWNDFINLKSLLSYFASRVLMDGKEWNDFINLKNLYYPILPAGFWWMAKNEMIL